MHQLKEILRLRFQNNLSVREIGRSCGLPASTVGDYLTRAVAAQLSWPLPGDLTEAQLIDKLIAPAPPKPPSPCSRAMPDWALVRDELRRPNMTLQLLWNEYQRVHGDGYSYSRYCELYQIWAAKLDPVLRQVHSPGEKVFVDWAGQTVPIHPSIDGEALQEGHVFIAVLGASNKTFAEAFPNEQLSSWVNGHCHAYTFFGGVTRATVPDNTKTAVGTPCRYEPVLHRTYQEMAEHYGTVILPTRPKKPRDKAKVETAVQIVQRQILAALRDHHFFSLGELNQTLIPLLARLNAQPFQKLDGSRDSWFEAHERAHLLPLPATPFDLATWSKAQVNIDYHVIVQGHYYSVPYTLIHQTVDVRVADRTVELFHHGVRVAAHPRSHQKGRPTTLEEHRPKSHQKYLQWTPGRMIDWATAIGPNCARVITRILSDRPHPEQGFRSCLGIIRLAKAVEPGRMEAACLRALHFDTCSYRSLQSILHSNLDRQPLEQELPLPSPTHGNLRGSPYYN